MRTAQRLAALGVVAAIVLSGCSNGKDSYSSAEKEEVRVLVWSLRSLPKVRMQGIQH